MPLSPEDFLRTCFVSNPPVEAHTGFTDAQGKAAHIDIDVIWPAQWGPEPFEDGLRCIRYHDVSFCTEGSSGGYNSLESKYMEPVTRFANAIFYTPTHSCHYAEVPISIGSSRCFALKRTEFLKKPCPLETCFGLVIFLPPGTVSIDAWTSDSPLSAQPPSYIHGILPGVLEMCHLHRPRVIMLSDEAKSVLLKVQFFDGDLALSSWRQRSEWPVRMHLAFLLWRDALKHRCLRLKNRPHVDHVQGALPSNLLLDKMLAHSPSGMADFDLFTMERKPQLWKHFLKWKEVAQACASQHALKVGTVLLLLIGKTIVSELPWRSPVPLWTLPDTDRSMVMQHPRQRDEVAEGALASSGCLTFHVTHLARVEDDTYSQVVFGVLKKHNVVVSSEMCLKLFDERRFPVGDYDDNDCTPFAERLDSWNVAEDMARREEAAYDRLRYLQGTMLPHSYGFYQFRMPDGHLCIGFIMERVSGLDLQDLKPGSWPLKGQEDFVRKMRAMYRALRYAGIDQRDWSVGQFIFPSISPCAASHHHDMSKLGLVTIDFAFAEQHLCLCHTPVSDDWGRLFLFLLEGGIERAVLNAHFIRRVGVEW